MTDRYVKMDTTLGPPLDMAADTEEMVHMIERRGIDRAEWPIIIDRLRDLMNKIDRLQRGLE